MSPGRLPTFVLWICVAAGCEKKVPLATASQPAPSPQSAGAPPSSTNTPPTLESLNAGTAYKPAPGDLSPEGFNWVHRDLGLAYSGATYHAHVLKLMIAEGFVDLNDKLLDRPGTVQVFGGTYSLNAFVDQEIVPKFDDRASMSRFTASRRAAPSSGTASTTTRTSTAC